MTRCLYKLDTTSGKLVPATPTGTPCTSCGADLAPTVSIDPSGTRWTCAGCGNLFAAHQHAGHQHDSAPSPSAAVQPPSNPAPSVPRKETAVPTATSDPVLCALKENNARLQAELDAQLFANAVAEKMGAGLSHSQATAAAVQEDPERHARYLRSYNRQHGRRAL